MVRGIGVAIEGCGYDVEKWSREHSVHDEYLDVGYLSQQLSRFGYSILIEEPTCDCEGYDVENCYNESCMRGDIPMIMQSSQDPGFSLR